MLTGWDDGVTDRLTELARSFASLQPRGRDADRASLIDKGPMLWARPTGAEPRMRIRDEGAALTLRAEVPGFSEDDIDVTLAGDALSIRGVRNVEPPEGYTVRRRERAPLYFSTTFRLPCAVDAERAEASIDNGILALIVPKAPEATPKRISVRSE